jgi:rubrerythrin
MKSLVGTKTGENLAKAFAGESQARNRYTIYASAADKEGHERIAEIFRETADNERAHAKILFDLLIQGLGKAHIKVDAEYPIGLGNTEQNLSYAAEGEKEEWGSAYPDFAEIAKEEGFPEVEFVFKKLVDIEREHERRFLDFNEKLKTGTLYKNSVDSVWKCSNCGYIHNGPEAPGVCPACKYPQGYFEVKANG